MPEIKLVERQVGSQWLITSPDVPGLYVAHVDPEVARREVKPAIEAMDRARKRISERSTMEHAVARYA